MGGLTGQGAVRGGYSIAWLIVLTSFLRTRVPWVRGWVRLPQCQASPSVSSTSGQRGLVIFGDLYFGAFWYFPRQFDRILISWLNSFIGQTYKVEIY